MKKIWSIRKKDETAVSPVIATILMVAITVVLAAVLYVMVLGIGGTNTVLPVVGMSKDSNSTNWTLSVISIQGGSGSVAMADVYVTTKTAALAIGLTSTVLTGIDAGTYVSGVTFVKSDATTNLKVGDYFVLNRTTYASGSTLTMTDEAGSGQYGTYTV